VEVAAQLQLNIGFVPVYIFSDIDEIVLSYIISILEDLGDDGNAEENIDVDQFIEMMDAYIPGFATIERLLQL
jgi:hypothetical protein